jgi:hypothetical protein
MKLTFIWQNLSSADEGHLMPDFQWIREIFKPLAGEQIFERDRRTIVDNCLLIDGWFHHLPRDYYRQFRGKNAWLLHLFDETYEGGYDVYDNFRGVIRTYWTDMFNPRRVMQIPLGSINGFNLDLVSQDAAQRPYLWSFLGSGKRGSRPEMLNALKPLKPSFIHVTDAGSVQPIEKDRYQEILRESIFVPCAMGNVNLDTFRISEALECGAIPVLEKRMRFDYFAKLFGPHPLPTFANWSLAARFLEATYNDRDALNRLQRVCSGWWSDYKHNLTARIVDFVSNPASAQEEGSLNWRGGIPGWQARELLRHHTTMAAVRRLKMQMNRLTNGEPLRKTHGTGRRGRV